jgi:hypothetical protein
MFGPTQARFQSRCSRCAADSIRFGSRRANFSAVPGDFPGIAFSAPRLTTPCGIFRRGCETFWLAVLRLLATAPIAS